jgi:hypothetical protein
MTLSGEREEVWARHGTAGSVPVSGFPLFEPAEEF